MGLYQSNKNIEMTTPENYLEVPASRMGDEPAVVAVDLDVVGIMPLSRLVPAAHAERALAYSAAQRAVFGA